MKPLVFLLAFALVCSTLTAQGIIMNSTDVQVKPGQLDPLNSNTSLFKDLELRVDKEGAFINQQGNGNTLELQTASNSNGVLIDQIGDENTVLLNLRANRIDYSVLQNGDNNMLLEYSTQANKQLLQRRIEQSGNGQNLIIHGQNSIIDRMQIIMNGSQSVIIRNTN